MITTRKFMVGFAITSLVVAGVAAYAALPSVSVPPSTVARGTLAVATPVNVLSVDAFTRTINQTHGSNAVLQHFVFAPGQSTGWHAHPGPNIVLVVGGAFTLIDEHCNETNYTAGQGFATGLDVHEAIAGSAGADFYSFYFLPSDATALRENENPPGCASR
jgi:quercetin dioxygenase-like cupin family protein